MGGFLADYVGKPVLNIIIGHFLEKGVKMAKKHIASLPKIPIVMPKMPVYPKHVAHQKTDAPLTRKRTEGEVIEAEYRLIS